MPSQGFLSLGFNPGDCTSSYMQWIALSLSEIIHVSREVFLKCYLPFCGLLFQHSFNNSGTKIFCHQVLMLFNSSFRFLGNWLNAFSGFVLHQWVILTVV